MIHRIIQFALRQKLLVLLLVGGAIYASTIRWNTRLVRVLILSGIAVLSIAIANLAADGIQVVEVRPGIMATDMTAGVREKYDALLANGLGRKGTHALYSLLDRLSNSMAK